MRKKIPLIGGILNLIELIKGNIGIIENGATATHSITAGSYVIWKNELYKASSAIAVDDALSGSNLTAVSNGGLNALLSEVKVAEISGTTSNNGVIGTDVDFDSIVLLSCWASSGNCATPAKIAADGKLAFRLSNTSNGSWTVVASQSRTVWYSYIEKPLPSYNT